MKKLVNLSILILAGFIVVYFSFPVIAYGFTGFPVLLLALLSLWILMNNPITNQSSPAQLVFQVKKRDFRIPLGIMAVLLLYITIVPMVTSSALIRTNDYRNLIGTVETGENLSVHMAPISIEKIRVVDQSLANLLGDKVLGAQPALGSQVRLGTFTIQKVRNELYWVAPLLHSGFFMWQKNITKSRD